MVETTTRQIRSFRVLRTLINAGADVKIRDQYGRTAVEIASRPGYISRVIIPRSLSALGESKESDEGGNRRIDEARTLMITLE